MHSPNRRRGHTDRHASPFSNPSTDTSSCRSQFGSRRLYEVARIVRFSRKQQAWLVHWQGYAKKDDTYEPGENLFHLSIFDEAVEREEAKQRQEEYSISANDNGNANSNSMSGKKRKLDHLSSVAGNSSMKRNKISSESVLSKDSSWSNLRLMRQQPFRGSPQQIERLLSTPFAFGKFELLVTRIQQPPASSIPLTHVVPPIDPYYSCFLSLMHTEFELGSYDFGEFALLIRLCEQSSCTVPQLKYLRDLQHFPLAALSFDLSLESIHQVETRVLHITYAATWESLQHSGFGGLMVSHMKLLQAQLHTEKIPCMLLVNCMQTKQAKHFWYRQKFVECNSRLTRELLHLSSENAVLMQLSNKDERDAGIIAIERMTLAQRIETTFE